MITTAKAFVTSDQKTHTTLEDAQKHEIGILWLANSGTPDVPEWVLANRDKLLDILTTTSTSKVRARAINGGKKKRKAAADPAPTPPVGPAGGK